MEIRRFGVGNRRPNGPPGTTGVSGQVIHSDARGTVAELAFGRRATIAPHSSPNTTWLIVIEGGGIVEVGAERARVAAGEAVLWPAGVLHGARTELSEMRAFIVELSGPDDSLVRGIVDGHALASEQSRSGHDADARPSTRGGEPTAGRVDTATAAHEGEPL